MTDIKYSISGALATSLMMDPFLLDGRFTMGAYRKILAGLSSGDSGRIVDALSSLSDTLVYGNHEVLGNFPILEVCQLLTTCLKSDNEAIRENAALCTFQVLEAHPASTRSLIISGALEQIRVMLLNFQSITTTEHLLRAAEVISQFHPEELARVVGVEPILGYFDFFTVIVQRVIMKTIAQMAQMWFVSDFSPCLGKIVSILKANDERVVKYALDACVAIGTHTGSGNFPADVVGVICQTLETTTDPGKYTRLLKLLEKISRDPVVGDKVIESKLNYERLLFGNSSGSSGDHEMAPMTLLLVLNLLPPIEDVSADVVVARTGTPTRAAEFGKEIQPLLVRCLMEKVGPELVVMKALIATMKVHPLVFSPLFLTTVCALAQQKHLAPYALLIAEFVPGPDVVNSGLLQILTSANRYQRKWYKDRLAALKSRLSVKTRAAPGKALLQCSTINELAQFVHDRKIGAFDLVQKKILDRIVVLANGPITGPPDVMQTFVDRLLDMLVLLPVPPAKGSRILSCDAMKLFSVGVSICGCDFLGTTVQFRMIDSILAIEGVYNQIRCNIFDEHLIESKAKAGRIGEIVQLPRDLGDMTNGEFAWLHRIMNTPNWQRLKVVIGHTDTSPKDMLFRAVHVMDRSRLKPVPDAFIQFATSDDSMQEHTELDPGTGAIDERMLKVLLVLKKIHAALGITMESSVLEKVLWSSLVLPLPVATGTSAALQIALTCPFLFSFKLRSYVLRAWCSSILPAMAMMHRRETGQPLHDTHNVLKCVVKRDQLFEDGVLLMKTVGVSQFQIEVSYEGEEGIGMGPTAEFYGIFGKEFSRKSHGLWRNEFTNKSEYAFDKMGLFPVVNANQDLFFVLGILCAKAIEAEFLVPLPFNPAFFKMVKGEHVSIEEVDPGLARSLASCEGLIGLPFVYPGTDIEMIEHGSEIEVTSENCEQYRALVIDYTCGSKLEPVIEAFRRGFGNVMQRCFDLLSAQEFVALISGDECSKVTLEDLFRHVELSNGYTQDSPQIHMLFEFLVQMDVKQRQLFFKFVTGSERLPVGGLSMLTPKLTIAKKVGCGDNSLPSVMTCTNYFKLPPYETREELVEKLLLAISEGQESFSLT